jgi:hypothetical protein
VHKAQAVDPLQNAERAIPVAGQARVRTTPSFDESTLIVAGRGRSQRLWCPG